MPVLPGGRPWSGMLPCDGCIGFCLITLLRIRIRALI